MERASASVALSDAALRFMEMAGGATEAAGEASPANRWHHPPSFYCPISRQILRDPVVLSDGHTYERRHIERWLEEHSTSPVSNEALPQKATFPNHALRNAIEEYFEQVFSVHRRAIRKTLRGPEALQSSLGSNEPLLHTVDALMQCSFLMNADLSIEVVLRQIMDQAKNLLGADAASVFLVDAGRQELYSTVNSTGGELRIPLSAGIAGHVATTGEPLLIHDTYSDDRFDRRNDLKTGFRTHNMMCVPLKFKKGGVLGVVQLINKTGDGVFSRSQALVSVAEDGKEVKAACAISFTTQDLQFLQVFASQAATAVANSGGDLPESHLESEPKVAQALNSKGHEDGVGDVMKQCFVQPAQKSFSKDHAFTAECPKLDGEQSRDKKAFVACRASAESKSRQPSRAAKKERCSALHIDCIENRKERHAKQSHSGCSLGLVEEPTRAVKLAEMLAEAFSSWQFDAFALAELTDNRPLSTLGMYLFQELGLVERFNLDISKLNRFFVEIENGYDDEIPYHNRAHAASVLHAMHALLEHGGIANAIAPAFREVGGSACRDGHLERLASLMAAAVHDVEHAGVSNEFLVRTGHTRAMLYNDQHVNEQHHAATAFAILSRPECNFLASLPSPDFRRIRSIIIELVVATDMANGGKIVKSFVEAFAISATDDSVTQAMPASGKDALLLLQVAMKCADLGHLALGWELHRKWVARLEEEFYAQGDREKALGHSVSFLMDRDKPGCSKTQTGFFQFVVVPLFRSLVSVAPHAQPMLDAILANDQVWKKLEMQGDKDSDSKELDVDFSKIVRPKMSSLIGQDSMTPTSLQLAMDNARALDASPNRKKSGRARQRAAKWWAAVRRKTPSPEPISPRRFPRCC